MAALEQLTDAVERFAEKVLETKLSLPVQEQLCRLIEIDRKELHLKAELARVLHERERLARNLIENDIVGEQSVFIYQCQPYYLLADIDEFDKIQVVPVRDLGSDDG